MIPKEKYLFFILILFLTFSDGFTTLTKATLYRSAYPVDNGIGCSPLSHNTCEAVYHDKTFTGCVGSVYDTGCQKASKKCHQPIFPPCPITNCTQSTPSCPGTFKWYHCTPNASNNCIQDTAGPHSGGCDSGTYLWAELGG